jgi:hypothetical protein
MDSMKDSNLRILTNVINVGVEKVLGYKMSDLILALLVLGLHGYWIYAVATYDWTKFEEDNKGDDFLKPYDK